MYGIVKERYGKDIRGKKELILLRFLERPGRGERRGEPCSLLTDPQVVSHEVNFAVTTERTIHLTNVENIFLFILDWKYWIGVELNNGSVVDFARSQ